MLLSAMRHLTVMVATCLKRSTDIRPGRMGRLRTLRLPTVDGYCTARLCGRAVRLTALPARAVLISALIIYFYAIVGMQTYGGAKLGCGPEPIQNPEEDQCYTNFATFPQAVAIGLGRVVALYCCSSASYQIC
jgi:hypothetical protein